MLLRRVAKHVTEQNESHVIAKEVRPWQSPKGQTVFKHSDRFMRLPQSLRSLAMTVHFKDWPCY